MEIDSITVTPRLNPVKRATPSAKLGKRMRTTTETIEVPSTQDFRPEMPNVKDAEIDRLKQQLKEKQDLITELLGENRQLRKQLDKKTKNPKPPIPTPSDKPTYAQKASIEVNKPKTAIK